MTNITIKDYFNISEILKNKNKNDFQNYQKSINFKYNKDKKLYELYEFYKTFKDENSFNLNMFDKLNSIKKSLLTIVFLLSFFITYTYFSTEINVKTYLLFSVALPFVYGIFSLIKIIRYKYPQKDEVSLLNTLAKKFTSKSDNKHNHIVKTYSIVMFVELGISYAVGVLVATIIIFWSHSITFYSETSYTPINIVEKVQTKQDRIVVSKSYWSVLITMLIFFVILLKLLLRYFANKILQKTISNSLLEQGELFFNVMQTNAIIYKNSHNKNQIISNKKNNHKKSNLNLSSKYFKLYYEMELDEAKKIDFYDEELLDKTFQEYSFALFDKEDEDEKVLSYLENLVLMFTSPESLADETFKSYIKQMLQNKNIEQIWVLPLVQKDETFVLANKMDSKYLDWQTKINDMIKNDKVSLYYEK